MKQFWLIRHGQSTSNAGLPTTDQETTPLTELGRAQAAGVAAFFVEPPDLIVTSPYQRTAETAAPARVRWPQVAHEVWPVQEFTYLNPALYHNRTQEERWPHVLEYWQQAEPRYRAGDGAESFMDMLGRAAALERRLCETTAERILVFTHGIFMRGFLWHWLVGEGGGRENMPAFRAFLQATRTPNGCMLAGVVTAEGKVLLGRVQTSHLMPDLGSE